MGDLYKYCAYRISIGTCYSHFTFTVCIVEWQEERNETLVGDIKIMKRKYNNYASSPEDGRKKTLAYQTHSSSTSAHNC